jgi:RecA-family ATPase
MSRDRRSQTDPIQEQGFSPVATRLSSVAVEEVDWLWPGRIPRGKITVLDGDPSLGKSTLSLDLAARVSAGRPLPGDHGEFEPAAVILMSAEDGMGDTIRPRLEEAGGDPWYIHSFEGISNEPGVVVPATIPTHVPELGDLIERHHAALVIIDPLTAYLHGGHNAYRDQDVRGALKPLARVAEQTGAAILVIRHLSKSGGANALYRGGGSIGIIGAARAGLIVAPDPDDRQRSILAVTKSNLAAKPDALAYRLVPGDTHQVARVQWEGTTKHTADDLLALDDTDGTARDEAIEFLTDLLSNGPVPSDEVKRAASAAGLAWSTVRRVKDRVGAVSRRSGFGSEGKWSWCIPTDGDPEPGDSFDAPDEPWASMEEPPDDEQEWGQS